MKSASTALAALLANADGQFLMADLYTFTLRSGVVLRYTSADIDLTVGGNVFGRGPVITGGRMRLVRGLEVDTCDITLAPGPSDMVAGVAMLAAIARGAFDRAIVKRERVFMASWGDTSAGAIVLFLGECADIEPGRTQAVLHVKSMTHLLDVSMPRRLYQPACPWVFGDANCGVDRAAYGVASAATAGSTASAIHCGLAQPAGYFDQGIVAFTGGPNAGISRSVRTYAPGVLTLVAPLPNGPVPGDSFIATPGCDKTIPTFTSTREIRTVPAASPYTVIVNNAATFFDDYGVALVGATTQPASYVDENFLIVTPPPVKAPDIAMVKVAGSPAQGQYALGGATYSFAAADAGRQVAILYAYATGNAAAPCWSRYNNVARFGGQPFVPVPETAI